MRRVSIKQLQTTPAKELKELPFSVTRYKKVIAEVYSPGTVGMPLITPRSKEIKVKVPKKTSVLVDSKDRVKGKKYKYVSYMGKFKEVS